MFRNEFLILVWVWFRRLYIFSYKRYIFLQEKIKVVLRSYKCLKNKYLNYLDFRISLYIFEYRYQEGYCLTFLRNLFINFYFFDKTEVRDDLGFIWISLSDFLSQLSYNKDINSWFFQTKNFLFTVDVWFSFPEYLRKDMKILEILDCLIFSPRLSK